MNLMDEVERIKKEGYSEANAEARLCQDIIIKAISQSSFKRNVTIKVQLINVNSEMKNFDLFFWLKKGALTPW